jgi:hypothetical protein
VSAETDAEKNILSFIAPPRVLHRLRASAVAFSCDAHKLNVVGVRHSAPRCQRVGTFRNVQEASGMFRKLQEASGTFIRTRHVKIEPKLQIALANRGDVASYVI